MENDIEMKVVLSKYDWSLAEAYNKKSKKTVLVIRCMNESFNGVEIILDQNLNGGGFRNGKEVIDNIRVHTDSANFEDLGYFRDYIEFLQQTDEFLTEVYKYCVENGYWEL